MSKGMDEWIRSWWNDLQT